MIGFDRPLRPEWIYNFLSSIEPGKKPSDFYALFENIAQELTGKEGKRKARTIVYRSFIYSLQDSIITIKNNYFIELCKKNDYKFAKPIIIMKLIADYEINQQVISLLLTHYSENQKINKTFITNQIIKKYGDKDIVRRSSRAFLTTLLYSNYLKKDNSEIYVYKNVLNEDQVAELLYCYSIHCLRSKQLDIHYINEDILKFFRINNLLEVAKKYNGTKWDFIKDIGRNLLLFR